MVGRRREFKVVYMFLLRRPTSSRTWGFRLGVRFEAGKCDQRRCRRCRRCRRARRRPRVWRRGQGCGGGEGWRRRCWVLRGVWRGNSLALLYCAAAMKRGAVVSLVTRQASPSSSPPPPCAVCVSFACFLSNSCLCLLRVGIPRESCAMRALAECVQPARGLTFSRQERVERAARGRGRAGAGRGPVAFPFPFGPPHHRYAR